MIFCGLSLLMTRLMFLANTRYLMSSFRIRRDALGFPRNVAFLLRDLFYFSWLIQSYFTLQKSACSCQGRASWFHLFACFLAKRYTWFCFYLENLFLTFHQAWIYLLLISLWKINRTSRVFHFHLLFYKIISRH